MTGVVAAMLSRQHLTDGWRNVSLFIALNEFARQVFIRGGLPGERIRIKPNFVEPDPGRGNGERDGFLFVGRLSPEKGVMTLLQAWRALPADVVLRVVGDGLMRDIVEHHANDLPNVEVMGQRDHATVIELMKTSRALIFPSMWYEGQPVTILEAFACGLPVIASDLGGVGELINEGDNGLLVKAGSATDLADKVNHLHRHPQRASTMGANARSTYLATYSGSRNYRLLMDLYDLARKVGTA